MLCAISMKTRQANSWLAFIGGDIFFWRSGAAHRLCRRRAQHHTTTRAKLLAGTTQLYRRGHGQRHCSISGRSTHNLTNSAHMSGADKRDAGHQQPRGR